MGTMEQIIEESLKESIAAKEAFFKQQGNDIEFETADINRALRILLDHKIDLTDIKIRSHTLDDLFLKLTGHELRL